MIVRLYRILPLLVVLGIIAAIVYLVVMYRSSPSRAKEVLIIVFTWLTGVLSALFLLVTLYAWGERNAPVTDLALSLLITAGIALAITRICRAVFLRRHPEYRKKATKTTWRKRRG